jgi:hypothetical protein
LRLIIWLDNGTDEPEENIAGLSFVNSRAFAYVVFGLAIGYLVSFVIGSDYKGNALLIYFIIGLFKPPVIFVQQLYLDVALVFIPILIAGLSGKLRSNRTISILPVCNAIRCLQPGPRAGLYN